MDRYADHVLHDLEYRLGQTLSVIQTSRQHIASRRE